MTIKRPHAPIRLRELRIAAGIGGKQLASAAGIRALYIYQIESGQLNPLLHKDKLAACAKVLGTSLAEVLRPAVDPAGSLPDRRAPVKIANLPALIAAPRSAPKRRGRPPDPAVAGEMVEIGITVGGKMLGGVTTNDLGALKRVLKQLFGGTDGSS